MKSGFVFCMAFEKSSTVGKSQWSFLSYKHIDDFEREHLWNGFLTQTGSDKFLFSHFVITVHVHLFKSFIGNGFLTLLVGIVFFFEQVKQIFHDSAQFFFGHGAIVVDVENAEYLKSFEIKMWKMA